MVSDMNQEGRLWTQYCFFLFFLQSVSLFLIAIATCVHYLKIFRSAKKKVKIACVVFFVITPFNILKKVFKFYLFT